MKNQKKAEIKKDAKKLYGELKAGHQKQLNWLREYGEIIHSDRQYLEARIKAEAVAIQDIEDALARLNDA